MGPRLDPPPGGATPFDHRGDLWEAFNRYYGTLWSEGTVDQPTKEVARLRNARVTGCGICKNLRFRGAREAGLTETHVACIDDDFAGTDLPDRWKLAVRWADAVIGLPAAIDPELRSAIESELGPAGTVELTATVATAIAFSKAAVAFGAPPEMPVTEVETPSVAPRLRP